MNKFFSPDGKLMTVLNKATNILFINMLTLVCCLPVFTVGAATTAKYYVTMKVVRGKEIVLWKEYLKSFKENFKQATIIWLIALVLGLFLSWDLLWLYSMGDTTTRVMAVIVAIILMIYGMILMFGFPMLARFQVTLKQWIQNSVILAVMNFPKGIIGLTLTLTPYVMIYFYPQWLILWLAIPIVSVYIISNICVGIFKKMEPEGYQDPDEMTEDEYEEYLRNSEAERQQKTTESNEQEDDSKNRSIDEE